MNDQMSQEMQQEEHSDFDAENEIDEMSMIAILTDLQTKLDGHAKDNQEICLDNENLKNELLQCKQEICRKEKSIAFLQSEKEKILSEKKELADSYLDDIVCLKTANKVARDMLQRFNMPTQTIPMLSKKPKKATDDLHKDILGIRNPGLDGNPARANIKQALGTYKDGDGDTWFQLLVQEKSSS
ncbi:hypothetical protein Tco_1543794 [Tanacetum coccineum]